MSDLRQLAKDRPCQVRLPCCNGDSSTTVLAHLRLIGISGMGLKCPDFLGAHACFACHSYSDTHHDAATQLAFAEGVFRTQQILVSEGVISW